MTYGQDVFSAIIDQQNGDIYEVFSTRNRTKIGIDNQKEKELLQTIADMQETLDNYYNKLVELGAIQIPKSPEEIAREAAAEQVRLAQEQSAQQMEINQALLQAIQSLKSEIGELKANVNSENSNQYVDGKSNEESGNDSKNSKKTAGTSRISAATSKNINTQSIG